MMIGLIADGRKLVAPHAAIAGSQEIDRDML